MVVDKKKTWIDLAKRSNFFLFLKKEKKKRNLKKDLYYKYNIIFDKEITNKLIKKRREMFYFKKEIQNKENNFKELNYGKCIKKNRKN